MKNTKLGSVQIYYSAYNKAAVLEKIVLKSDATVTGLFVPLHFRSRERKDHRLSLPWNFRSVEHSLPRSECSKNFRSMELSHPWNLCSTNNFRAL